MAGSKWLARDPSRARRRSSLGVLATLAAIAATVPAAAPAGAQAASPAAAPSAEGSSLGEVTGFSADGDSYLFESGDATVRVIFLEDDVFRLQLAPDGTFTDPANDDPEDPEAPDADIVAKTDYGGAGSRWSDEGDHYALRTGEVVVRADKSPLRFSVHRTDGSLVWRETEPLRWTDDATTQTLARGADEQYLGGGMQNGRFSHRGETIQVARNFDWDDGGYPNASPYYMSTAGYGVLRNTFAPGTYAFDDPVTTTHQEQRFDAYYFVGDLKHALDEYTELTGRPFMPPIYGLEFGDADCYNRSNPDYTGPKDPNKWVTPDAIDVAEGYVEHDMPRGWMLVNDGYGCEYQQLEHTGDELRARMIDLGLWTQRALTNQEYEVGTAGVRVRKLDVAWVGSGYRHALTACEDARGGIERYSDARGFVWMVEGWAGAQRCAVMWTGDHSGTLDSIRWQIPAIHGSGNSGVAYTAGDVDGIFGGSAESYVRDLQWKVFTPALMGMSGWAAFDKQPWRRGEPYTSINRSYLELRERLLPYFYTHAAQAYRTGTPIARSLILEYPDDPRTWDDTTLHEFLAGEDFLVAPVFEDADVRDGIYLPEGRWVDYWTGTVYEGPRTINDYRAPLDTLPLFVRAGAIVPMWKEGINNHREQAPDDPLTLDIYPRGTESFTLYEDDRVTRAHAEGEHAWQRFDVRAPVNGRGSVTVRVGASRGSYDGKPTARPYEMVVHTGSAPENVHLNGHRLTRLPDGDAYGEASEGWYFDADDRGGVVRVKTPAMDIIRGFRVTLTGTSAVGGTDRGAVVPAASFALAGPSDPVEPGQPAEVVATFTNDGDRTLRDAEVSLTPPEGWQVSAGSPARFDRVEPGGSRTIRFEVAVPASTPRGQYPVSGRVSFSAGPRGPEYTTGHTISIGTLPPPPSGDTWVSDMDWLVAENGWGPAERDTSNGESAAGDGGPLLLDGVSYDKGVGAHAYSQIRVFTGGACSRFTAKVGVDDSRSETGSVTFEVHADEEKVFETGLVRKSTPTIDVDVAVEGARFVDLIVTDGGNGKTADHGNWALATLHCAAS